MGILAYSVVLNRHRTQLQPFVMNLKVLVTLAFVLLNGNFEAEASVCGVNFNLVEGDYPGWGQIGSYFDIGSTDYCALICLSKTSPDCRSYEYSNTERRCNLNTVERPTDKRKYKDYAFCVSTKKRNFEAEASACGVNFNLVEGDYPGWGQVGSHSDVWSTDECAWICLYQTSPACRSYEYSNTERHCNLNTVDRPTDKRKYKDYAFCVANSDIISQQSEIAQEKAKAKIAQQKKDDTRQKACNAKRPSWCAVSGLWNEEMECRCKCTCNE